MAVKGISRKLMLVALPLLKRLVEIFKVFSTLNANKATREFP